MGKGMVLVGVLKSRRDLELLFWEKWYRIPAEFMPKRKFTYVAFYQPAVFGRQGKRIMYYARVVKTEARKRIELLPRERAHPRASADYVRITVDRLTQLSRPIINTSPRRISFGFTTLRLLKKAKNILELYQVAPTEDIMKCALRDAQISAQAQYSITIGAQGKKKRYRLDFAIMCRRGGVAIECDNKRAHSGGRQRERDTEKDTRLRRRGWAVVRLNEAEIMLALPQCIERIRRAVKGLGGLVR